MKAAVVTAWTLFVLSVAGGASGWFAYVEPLRSQNDQLTNEVGDLEGELSSTRSALDEAQRLLEEAQQEAALAVAVGKKLEGKVAKLQKDNETLASSLDQLRNALAVYAGFARANRYIHCTSFDYGFGMTSTNCF